MLILAPLAFLRRLDSLRHTSFIALFAIGTRANYLLPGDRADRWLDQHTFSSLWSTVTLTPWKVLQSPGRSASFTLPPRSCQLSQFRCSLSPVPRMYVPISTPPVLPFTPPAKLFPIYNELVNNTQRRMNIVIGTSIGSAVGVYEIVGVFGYLTFGSKVRPSALKFQLHPSHHGRLEPISLQCIPPLHSSLLLDN